MRGRKKDSEAGYVLLGVMILLALFMIAMAVAAPRIAAEIQRDRDLETMQRGKQYIRATQLYYRQFNKYPPNIDALVKTNEIRYLRKRYLDPTTGKDDWKPVYFGQNKTPMAMGFFGVPLAGGGGVIAGTGPGGGPGVGIGQDNNNNGNNNGGISNPGIGQNGNQNNSGVLVNTGSNDPNSNSGDSSQNGQTLGGGGIIGVSPVSPKQSIFVYKTKNHYNEWEFLYSPASDQQGMTGATGVTGQLPGNNPTTPNTPNAPNAPNNPNAPNPPPQ